MTLGTYPAGVPKEYLIPPAAFEAEIDFPRFTNIAAKMGLDTFNLSGGAIVDDFDGDDNLDILTSTWDTKGEMRFFRNEGDGTFSDRTASSGLAGIYGGLNLKQADYDNDGNLDVLVLRGAWLGPAGRHPNSLLRGGGDGTFTDVTFAAGLGEVNYPTQTAAWGDHDNDGDLDLYIGNENTPRISAPSQLFRNNGDGTFTNVAARAGVENNRYAKGVVFGDFNGDRFADIYVSNYKEPNRLYRNNGDGTFRDVAPELGVTRPEVSFPTWFWDFDNDGDLDLFVSSYAGRVDVVAEYYIGEKVDEGIPCLYRNDGGRFQEIAREQNLTYPILPMGSNFGDLDGDGYLDFYLGMGDPDFDSLMPNLLFLNKGGSRFVNATIASGFGHLQKGHAVSFADLDNDGDMDVFEQMGGAFKGDAFRDALYENPGFGNRWITVALVGVHSNRSAIGARIHVRVLEDGESLSIYRQVTSGGSFRGQPAAADDRPGKSRLDPDARGLLADHGSDTVVRRRGPRSGGPDRGGGRGIHAHRAQRTSPGEGAVKERILVTLGAWIVMVCGCTKSSSPERPGASVPGAWFREVAREAGITFVHDNGARGDYQLPEIMGPGCAWLDYDQDGYLDAYLLGAGSDPARARNRLYRGAPGGRLRRRHRRDRCRRRGLRHGVRRRGL